MLAPFLYPAVGLTNESLQEAQEESHEPITWAQGWPQRTALHLAVTITNVPQRVPIYKHKRLLGAGMVVICMASSREGGLC